VPSDEASDPTQEQLAARRLLDALRRYHRREPLRADVRVDTLIAQVHGSVDARPAGHRGAARLTIDDAALRAVVDGLVKSGAMERRGHRVRLPEHQPGLSPEMRERVDRLLGGLREAGAAPPPIDGIAARLGIPPGVVAQLRAAGEVVSVAPGIDYPRATWLEISERLDRLARGGRLNVARVRDDLRASRRHAEAILRHLRAGPRPGSGSPAPVARA